MTAEKGRKLKKSFVDEMQSRILSGQLKPGDRLPPERELAEELLYVQSCRASLEKAIGGGMARLVWHWRSGAVTTVVFRRQNNQMRMTTRTGGSGAA